MPKNYSNVEYPAKPPAFAKDSSINVLDLFSLKGKVASITGASQGIGFAIAEAYAQAGADVALWYNSHNPSEKAEALASKYGVKVKTYKVSITDSSAVDAAIKQQVEDFGHIDILVANAGVIWDKGDLIDEPNDDEWDRVIRVNVDGVYYTAKAIGKHFKQRGKGSLIITGSMSGRIVNVPNAMPAYTTSKAAVIHLAKSLAVEWAAFARVNCVSPGYVRTEMTDIHSKEMEPTWCQLTPMGRIGEPVEMVGAYLYLASDASTYTTGTDLLVDGGYSAL